MSRGLRILLFLVALVVIGAAAGALTIHQLFLADLPDFQDLDDYEPMLTSVVLDRDGQAIGEFYDQRRRLVAVQDLPAHVPLAFIAAEDANFYEHEGLDYVSILRAAWVNLRAGGQIKQGASTITQQTVKGLLLSPERKMSRKVKEMILARRLEERFTKDEILFLYLNQIYFGQGAYGVSEAARSYFGKDVRDLTLSEAALLAGLPQRPSDYSPYNNPDAADGRRRYVLRRMFEEGMVPEGDMEAALAQMPKLANPPEWDDYGVAAYFTEEVRRVLVEQLGGEVVRQRGLQIETTLDLELQRKAVAALRNGLEALDHRQGWRGPLRTETPDAFPSVLERLAAENGLAELTPEPERALLPRDHALTGLVTRLDQKRQTARVAFAPGLSGTVRIGTVAWGRTPNPEKYPYTLTKIRHVFEVGHVARFTVLGEPKAGEAERGAVEVTLAQEPAVEGALLSLDVVTGEVLAMVGGYDFARSEFNRTNQARRQPGSAFKPLVYAAALEKGYTGASIIVDRPVVYDDGDTTWRPENYGREFLGRLTMREALARSVNNATIHLFREVGIGYTIDYARRLGITSPLPPNLSLALGSSGLTLHEITRAYAVFPRGGRYLDSRFIRRVLDREGNVLLENAALQDHVDSNGTGAVSAPPPGSDAAGDGSQRIQPENAYLATTLLRAVVEDGRGTGRKAQVIPGEVGGKTGTTNEQGDAWFVGFSPDVATGVWVGFDRKRVLGRGETGGRAALPIWIDFMKDAVTLRGQRQTFEVPAGIVFARIDAQTGLLGSAASSRTFLQAFREGTAPDVAANNGGAAQPERKKLRLQTF